MSPWSTTLFEDAMISLQERLQRILLAVTPALVTFALVLLELIGQQRYGIAAFLPILPLGSIYYWSLHSPRRMPYGVAFFSGLLYDSLFGLPLGVSSLLFMLFKWLLHAQHRQFSKEAFGLIWLCLAALAAVVMIGQWALGTLYSESMLPVEAAFVQYTLTVLIYPVMHWLFMKLDSCMLRRHALLVLSH